MTATAATPTSPGRPVTEESPPAAPRRRPGRPRPGGPRHSRRPRRPRGPGHSPSPRRLLVAAAVALAVAVVVAVAGPRIGGGPGMHEPALLDPAVQGTYRLGDGEYLTLWGTETSPGFELTGRVTPLEARGTDRYASARGEVTVSVERDGADAVRGLLVGGAEQPPRYATRDPLYHEEEVDFSSSGAELSGSLLIPHGPGPHPAVVLVHGAAPVRRDATHLLASHLARRGVAALIYDKRGVGGSTGSYAEASFDDLTDDALAGASLLRTHSAVDPSRIGVLGFSQGAWIVAQAAQRSDDVAFVAAFSPSGFSPADQQAWLHGSMLAARGFDRSAMDVADRVGRMLYSSLDLVDAGLLPPLPHVPGFWFHALDPHLETAALWEGVRQPVLAVWGELDCQVPAHDSRAALGRALRAGGNADVTMAVLPGADHGLTLADPCAHETGLGDHGGYAYAGGALSLAADWINDLSGAAGPGSAPPDRPTGRPEGSVLGWHLEPPAPAPWYGTFAFQTAMFVTLVAAFGAVAGHWVVATVRRRGRGTRLGHLTGVAALAGLVATVTGFAAVAEIAMLGGTHAAFLVGGPTVEGPSVLLGAGRLLVPLAAGLGVAAVVAAVLAGRGDPAVGVSRRSWVLAVAIAALVGWGSYWTLVPPASLPGLG